jgi:hypothetical protein
MLSACLDNSQLRAVQGPGFVKERFCVQNAQIEPVALFSNGMQKEAIGVSRDIDNVPMRRQ